ncbi:MAG: SNF2-related protein [Armatimonadota bacterium]
MNERFLKPSSTASIALLYNQRARAGVLDLGACKPGMLSCGSVSLKDRALEEEWAGPPSWWREAKSTGTGSSHESEPAPKTIPLAERLSVVLQPPLSLCMAGSGPLEWPSELLDFQKDGVQVLIEQPCVLLADDMGLGKTIQASAAIRLLAIRGGIERALVVAPAAVIRNWREELAAWAPELRVLEVTGSQAQRAWKWDARVHVKIVSYETLRSDHGRIAKRHGQWDLVCLDEAQRIKNSESAISSMVKNIGAVRRWALTGTPLENSVDDLRSILSFLRPVGPDGRRTTAIGDNEVLSVLSELQLRRKKSEVLADLPPKMVKELFIPLSAQQREEYDQALAGGIDELRRKGTEVTTTDVLALINHLKQVCNFSAKGGRSSKLDDLASRLHALRLEGHKALIFSQFTNESHGVRRIARALSAFGPVIYTGDMSAQQRLQTIKAFQDDPRASVLILSLKAGGVGLNLQQASYVFHFDRWWNPASESQAEDRSHRIGQTRGVSVYKYICENTVEERIHEVLLAKRALFAEYVDDVCMDLSARLTDVELFGLFGLEPPVRASHKVAKGNFEQSGLALDAFVKRHLSQMGYHVTMTYSSGDQSVDYVGEKTDQPADEAILLVRCLNQPAQASREAIKEFVDLLPHEDGSIQGIILCPVGFTQEAIAVAKRYGVRLLGSLEEQRLFIED